MHYLSFCAGNSSLGIQPWLDWILCFRVSHMLQSKCYIWLRFQLKVWLSWELFLNSLTWFWEDSVPRGFWIEDLSSSFPIGKRPPSVLYHMGVWNIIDYFIKAREIEAERIFRQGGSHNLLRPDHESDSHHLCLIPLVISKSLDSIHFQGKT